MNYNTLKFEVQADPLARNYAAMTDQQIADALNAADRPVLASTPVTANILMDALGPDDGATVLDKLEAAAASNSPVKWALKSIHGSGLDVSRHSVRDQLDRLALGGVLTDAEVGRIKALAERTVSRAHELGLPTISAQMIEVARERF